MTNSKLAAQIDTLEAEMGTDMNYMRAILAGSEASYRNFTRFMAVANHGEAAPEQALILAQLTAMWSENCRPCFGIVEKFARAADIPDAWIEAVRHNHGERLPEDMRFVHAFARAMSLDEPEADQYRRQLEATFGHAVVVELTLAVAMARVYPAVKRGLGYAVALDPERRLVGAAS